MNDLWKKNAAFALALALTVCTVSPNAAEFLTAAEEMPDVVSLPSEASAEETGDDTSVESITDISDAIVKLDADNKVAAVKINGKNEDPSLLTSGMAHLTIQQSRRYRQRLDYTGLMSQARMVPYFIYIID